MAATAVLQLTAVCSNTHFLSKVQSRYSQLRRSYPTSEIQLKLVTKEFNEFAHTSILQNDENTSLHATVFKKKINGTF
jgi:hypothetical protein